MSSFYAFDQGQFWPLLIRYTSDPGTDKVQAIEILETAITTFSLYSPDAIYITYSANEGQTQTIRSTYASGKWQTGTNGANQASVMRAMEQLMLNDPKYQPLQGKMRIAPITTLPNSTALDSWLNLVEADINAIHELLKGSNIVFGWVNQGSDPLYAHAINNPHGVVKSFPPEIHDLIQNNLADFKRDFPRLAAPKDI